MSSSTSDSNDLQLSTHIGNPITLVIAGIAVFLTLTIAISATTLYVDPYDCGLSPVRKALRRDTIFRKSNVALWAAFDIQQLDNEEIKSTDIVLLGDSRLRLFSGGPYSQRLYPLDKATVLDLAFGGASIRESIDSYREVRHRIGNVSLVILSLPYDRLSDPDVAPSRTREVFRESRWPIRYFLNINTFQKSVPYLFEPNDHSSYAVTTRPSELGKSKTDSNGSVDPLGKLEIRTWARQANATLKVDDAIATFDSIVVPFLEELALENTRVVIYVPPNSPRLESFLTVDLRYRFETFLAHVETHARTVRLDPQATVDMPWVDDWHVTPQVGPYLFDLLWPALFVDEESP